MDASQPIMILGRQGQVAWELAEALAPLGTVHALGHEQCDLANADRLRECVRRVRPRVIVNAAAYTAVDKAESDVANAQALNAKAPEILAHEAKALGVPLIHYSTDYVFAGDGIRPYVETDATAPQSVYGSSKLAGEQAIVTSGCAYLIFRTSWVYGARGTNFLRTMLRLAHEREELRVVADQTGSPTWSRMLALATAQIIAQGRNDLGSYVHERRGVYHMTAGGQTNWHAFASAILELDPRREKQRCRAVIPLRTDEYPTAARRPAYSVLDNSKLARTFGVQLPDWRWQLERVMHSLA